MTTNYPFRKPMRLKKYDYSSPGTYFLTICAKNRKPLFANIDSFDKNGVPVHRLSENGKQIDCCIRDISAHYPGTVLDHYVIMPNHVHLLISIKGAADGAPGSSRPTELVPRIVSALKRLTNKQAGQELWQTGYMDHVIRNAQDYRNHWSYIEHNPFRWAEDQYFV